MKAQSSGLASTLGAYLIWGVSPIFWKQLTDVSAGQLLAHRIVWCAVLLALLLASLRRWGEIRAVLSSRTAVVTLLATAVCVSINWLLYLWAVLSDRILQASLGYYINPLLTVLLALVFLGEKLSRAQWISVGLAAVGVGVLTVSVGSLPWLSLALAASFGIYGLLRKRVEAEAAVGQLIETSFLAPIALGFLVMTQARGEGVFGTRGAGFDLLLVLSGLITAAPLLLFAHGVRRLRLSTVGFLQYLAPTLQFLLAVLVYREPFGRAQLIAFLFIWAALALFSHDVGRRWRQERMARSPA